MKKIIIIFFIIIIIASTPCFCGENDRSKEDFFKSIDAGDVNVVKQILNDHAELAN